MMAYSPGSVGNWTSGALAGPGFGACDEGALVLCAAVARDKHDTIRVEIARIFMILADYSYEDSAPGIPG
jgi:hypothetical protein